MLFIGSSIYGAAMARRAGTAEGSHWPPGGSADSINAEQTFTDPEHNQHIDSSDIRSSKPAGLRIPNQARGGEAVHSDIN